MWKRVQCTLMSYTFFPLSSQDDKAFIEKSLEDSEQVQVKHRLVRQSGNYLKYHLFKG